MITVPESYSKETIKELAVNQIALGANAVKTAVARDINGGKYYLVNAADDVAVYEAEATGPVYDTTNHIEVYHFDFTPVTTTGSYYIASPAGRSYTFEISADPYGKVTAAMIKMLYYQRCGCALDEQHAGLYKHGVCHTTPAYIFNDKSCIIEDISGGWHDAGDYGRYITPANQTVFNMMYAYELFKSGVSDDLDIPETGNGIPDILNEAKYELDWMLKMQDPSGGVYHKVTTENFAGNVMPEDDEHEIQTALPVAIPATGGFAAAMACAYRVYLPFLPDFAERCLKAAKRAFDYAYANYRGHMPYANVAPCATGSYGDLCCLDEVYWAAAEMFRSTGDKYYEKAFEEFFNKSFSKVSFGAYNQGGHGSLCYCLCDNAKPELKAKVLAEITKEADKALKTAEENAYMHALYGGDETHENEYYWGSNAVLTNKCANMISAAILNNTDKYDQALADSISYIFGRNYLSKCYVTGFGTDYPKHPHHRPSMFDGVDEPVPGMVAGGPNDRKGQRPKRIQGVKQSENIDWENMPAAGCYIDWEWNWTANEITIYWNSSCFYVTAYLRSKEK